MITTPWILISILSLIILLAAAAIFISKKNKRPPDYYNLFIIGVIWLVLGIPIENYILSILGAIFLAVGLINKKKWNSNRVRWSDLDDKEKRVRWIIIGILAILILAGLAVYLLPSAT